MSVNFAEATLRIEGVSDYLKGRLMDKLSSEEVLKKLMEQPEQLMDVLKLVADKVNFFLFLLFRAFDLAIKSLTFFYLKLII